MNIEEFREFCLSLGEVEEKVLDWRAGEPRAHYPAQRADTKFL